LAKKKIKIAINSRNEETLTKFSITFPTCPGCDILALLLQYLITSIVMSRKSTTKYQKIATKVT